MRGLADDAIALRAGRAAGLGGPCYGCSMGWNSNQRLLRVLLLLALLAPACEQYDLPEEWVETEHFRYYYRAEDPPCPMVLERLETHYDILTSYLGVTLPEGQRIHYYKFVDAEDFYANAPCSRGSACYQPSNHKIFTYEQVQTHEMLHAYTMTLGKAPALFSEGIAEALSCSFWTDLRPLIPGDFPIESLLENKDFRDSDLGAYPYQVAGSFTLFLLERFGVDAWRSFYSRLSLDTSAATIAEQAEQVFGEPFADTITAWRETLSQPYWRGDWCLEHCSGDPPALVLDASAIVTGEVSCTSQVIPVDVPEDTALLVRFDSEATVNVRPCRPGPGQPLLSFYERGPVQLWLQLGAGSYLFKVRPSTDATATEETTQPYRLEMQPRPALIADRCEDAEIQIIPSEISRVTIVTRTGLGNDNYEEPNVPGMPDQAIRFTVDRSRMLVQSYVYSYDRWWLTICTGGCPNESGVICAELPYFQSEEPIELLPSEVYTIVVDSEERLMGFLYLDLLLEG